MIENSSKMEIGPTTVGVFASVTYTFSLFALLVMHIALDREKIYFEYSTYHIKPAAN